MARKRTIDPELWRDERIVALSWGALPVYIGLISIADDEGRFVWSVVQVAGHVAPRRPNIADEDIERWMDEIAQSGLVRVYEVDGRRYAHHPNWGRYQYVNRPTKSKLPAPDADELPSRRFAASQDTTAMSLFEPTHGHISESHVHIREPHVPYGIRYSESDVDTEEDAQAREPDPMLASGALPAAPDRAYSSALDFRRWFVSTGIELGALPAAPDRAVAIARESVEDAADLLARYGREECEVRSRRLFAAHLRTDDSRIFVTPSIGRLAQFWGYRQLQTDDVRPRRSRVEPSRAVAPTRGARGPWIEVMDDGSEVLHRPGLPDEIVADAPLARSA